MQCQFVESARLESALTRTDLLVAIATLFTLGALLVNRVGRADIQSDSATCLNNHRALAAAWTAYANDHSGLLVMNLSVSATESTISAQTYLNWANNILSWGASSTADRTATNLALAASSQLFPYLQSNLFAFKCPADIYLSPTQQKAGWQGRTRSYSMNGFMGQAELSNDSAVRTGQNIYVPGFRQFLQLNSIPNPGATYVFLDEHPDSINDGLFLNVLPSASMWGDQPASYHDRACSFSFADGHTELHTWESTNTVIPVRYNYRDVLIPKSQNMDYRWLANRTSVDPTALAIRRIGTNQLQIVWSLLPTNIVLRASTTLVAGSWTNIVTTVEASPGQRTATLDTSGIERCFGLFSH
jgi:prepilin-type processing-associated H-X9-DG protein